MSLQVWLPLTKDLRQQGLGNFNISTMGTLSFVNGNLGKAINFNNATSSTNAIVIDSNLCEELGTEYSAAVWVCPLGSHVNYNGCIISSGNWNTPNKRWSFGLSSDNSQVDVFGFNYNTYINCDIPINTWTHITCVHKNGITKLYKNGIYVGEKQMAQSVLDSDKTFTRIGMCSYGNFFGFNGNISDLRIYDHALSSMEVKQLSQGLILHYPLNRQGFGQENLLSGNNSNIEYDTSGYCNNGTRTGIFSWTSDTPKYSVSSIHTGSNYIYLNSPPAGTQTIAVWVKWNTIPSGQSVILVDNGSGIGLGLMSTGILCSTSKAGNSYTFSKANLVANTWYHFVIVKTGTTTRKLYINGVEQTTTSHTSNWTYSVNQLQLGKRSTTSDGFVGKLCDFRAYATALSADDVKSLYQNCAIIDPDGTIRGQIRS